MELEEAKQVIRGRVSLLQSIERIVELVKKNKKKEVDENQLSLFDIEEFAHTIEKPKIKEYKGHVDIIEWANIETELMGVPVLYNPLQDYEMYEALFCNHSPVDILEFNTNKSNVVIMDRITLIEHKRSKKGNKYARIYISTLGEQKYFFLFGDNYKDNIAKLFKNEIYLLQIKYKVPTPEFDMESISIDLIKNVRDVDIDAEYERLIKNEKNE